MQSRDYNDRTCVVVVDMKGMFVGLIVDSVSEVISIPEQDIVPPPKLSTEGILIDIWKGYRKGWK